MASVGPQSAVSPIGTASTDVVAATENQSLPSGNIDPLYINEDMKWMFRYRSSTYPPPAWTRSNTWPRGNVDFMVSEDFVIFQPAQDGDKLAYAAGMIGRVAALAAPLVAIPVLAGAIAVERITGTGKHPGYGKKQQFRPESLAERFLAGDALWARRAECEFRSLRARLLIDTNHYYAIIGKFTHASGVHDLGKV